MKSLLVLTLSVLTAGCGSRTTFTKVPSNGTNCTTVQTSTGAQIKCDDGTSSTVVNGSRGANGTSGTNGVNGRDGVDLTLKKGLKCSVYDSSVVNRSSGLITILANATPKFTKVIELFDVGDSLAANGFPKFTATEQALIGTEDYALDCDGYINIPVSNYYNFKLLSDDNARLVVNNVVLINMDVLQPPTWGSVNSVILYKGLSKINILYYQGPLTQIALKLQIQGVSSSGLSNYQDVPGSLLFNM